MKVTVQFFSYIKELAGCDQIVHEMAANSSLGSLQDELLVRFPRLVAMKKSTLLAVGVEYQTRDYVLKEGDEVSLFPPVQGG